MEQKNNFLHKKLPDLQKSPEVQDAVDKQIRLTDEKIPNTPEARLGAYMDRLEKIFLNEDEETRKRNVEMLRDKIHDAFVIKREDVPESYFELQKRIARERGQPVEDIPQEVKEQMIDVIIEDQKQSLDSWVDYLTSNDAVYPTWFKYFVFRNITKLSQFDKELSKFKERTKATTSPFPDIFREPLAEVADLYETAQRDKTLWNDPDFQSFLSKKFPAQYAEKIQKSLEHSQENREQIQGEWVCYKKGDMEGAKKLFESLQGKGTGWCTAGHSTAETQIKRGDFYVYYSNNNEGVPVNPRLAIRMEDNKIGEVRGTLPHQEVDPMLQDTIDEKLSTFGNEAESYRKKSADMRRLTSLEKTMQSGGVISKEDFLFLYEINGNIEGFGYNRDPRIESLRALITKEQVATFLSLDESVIETNHTKINEATVLYLPRIREYLDQSKPPYNLREGYDKLLSNQKKLNNIINKVKTQQELSSDELRIIYEIDNKFEGVTNFRSEIPTLLSGRNFSEDFKQIFGQETNAVAEKGVIDEATNMLFLDRKIYRKSDKNYTKKFEDTARYNILLRKFSTGEDITRADLVLIYEAEGRVDFFEDFEERQRRLSGLKIDIREDQYLMKALGLEQYQLAHNLDEITDDTVLYIPEIAAYLSNDTNRGQYEDKKKLIYDTRLKNAKTIKRISKKIEKGEDLSTEEIQFIFRDDDHFELPYGSQKDPLNGETFRDKVSRENIETVFNKDLAEALEKVPGLLQNWAYFATSRNESNYFPCLESREDGSFLMCTSVGIEELGHLAFIDEDLRKFGYKLASSIELESFLSSSDLFSSTNENQVYGAGYIWIRSLWDTSKNRVDPKIGNLLSLDDKRLGGEMIVSSQKRMTDEGYPESQRALIAITKVTDDGFEKYDTSEKDDELYMLQDRLSKK